MRYAQHMNSAAIDPSRVRRLTRAEYDELVAMGWFVDERVELLHGQVVEMSPSKPRHGGVIARLTELFVLALHGRAVTRPQTPFAASDDSEPEPDLAVVVDDDPWNAHPSRAYLAVEVADSSLRKDRHVKGPLYAAAGIPEYWIVNLVDGVVEVHTDPLADRYGAIRTARRGETITLTVFPDVTVQVDVFLPPEG